MTFSTWKHLRSYKDEQGTARHYFVATYVPKSDPAVPSAKAPLPVTVKFRLNGQPGEPAFIDAYHRMLESIRQGAEWVR